MAIHTVNGKDKRERKKNKRNRKEPKKEKKAGGKEIKRVKNMGRQRKEINKERNGPNGLSVPQGHGVPASTSLQTDCRHL